MNLKYCLFSLAFLVFACSSDIQDFNQLQNRDGIYFQVNAETAFSGKTESRYANGNLELEGSIEQGYKEGVWTSYYENTQKKSQGKYVRSEKDGTWSYWEENGKELGKENYQKGVLMTEKSVENKEISKPTSNVENSIKTAEKASSIVLESPEKVIKMSQLNSSIKKGKVRKMFKGEPYTGPVIDYDENGVKSMTGYYKDGLREGKWTYFYPSGDVKLEKFFN